jgi:hypothetical protein
MNTTSRLLMGLFASVILSGVVATSAPTPAVAATHREKARSDVRHARMDARRARQLAREGNYAAARQKQRAARKRWRMARRQRYRANH